MEPKLLVVLPDQQVPYHDKRLHQLVLRFLRANEVAELVLSGDFVDFTQLSTHPPGTAPHPKEHRSQALREAIEMGADVLTDYTDAVRPGCRKRFVPGNHEQRLQSYLLRQAPELSWLPSLTVSGLLGLPDLAYEWVGAVDGFGPDYPHGQAIITPKLAVRHGWLARQGAGATALKTLETLGYSIIVGHTHRQAIVHKTYHEIDGSLRTLQAVEAGTLAMVRGGLGYAVAPDWTPGFATAWLWPDGKFKTSLATYVNGELLWEKDKYTTSAVIDLNRKRKAA